MSKSIICPHCGQQFDLDGATYESIITQIRNAEFDAQLHERLQSAEKEKQVAVQLATSEAQKSAQEELSAKDAEIAKLRGESDAIIAKKDAEHTNALATANQEIAELKAKISNFTTEKQLAIKEVEQEIRNASQQEIEKLKSDLSNATIKISEVQSEVQLAKTKNELELSNAKSNFEQQLNLTKEKYENELTLAHEETERYKDFKARQSTKAIGESLEIYCYNEFNKIRAIAYPNSYFEKDNKVSKETGSKGDFIFREWVDEDHANELISVMFECKNEADTTEDKARHTNESFLKELDKDRREKGCEYAVLVSMLEADNDFYNQGIVDVSYKYPKMYVVRPQFFLTLLSTLVNAARSTTAIRNELVTIQNENRDYRNFEGNLELFKSRLTKNITFAQNNYSSAIDQIDKAINDLEKTREFLRKANSQYDTTLHIADSMDIPTLTKGAPSVLEQINETREANGEEAIKAKRTRKKDE